MKNIVKVIFLIFLAIGFTSCLKYKLENLPEYSVKDITGVSQVEYRYIGTTTSPASGQQLVQFIVMSNTATIDTAAKTVAITVSKPANFPSSEAGNLSLSKLVITLNISTAARIAPLNGAPLLGVPGDWSKPNSYRVTAADGSTKDWTITVVLIANKYEGNYTLTGTMTDYTSSSLTGFYPDDVNLIAQSSTSVALFDNDNNKDYYHHILSGGSASSYGEFCPVFTFDANNNVISVVNKYGQPSATRGRSAELDPSGVNKWDPTTKVLKVKYWMNQTGVSGHKTLFDETFTLK